METVREQLAYRLKEAREEAGLDQIELGERVGKSQQVISAYERGVRQPDADMLRKLADALETTVGQLFGEAA